MMFMPPPRGGLLFSDDEENSPFKPQGPAAPWNGMPPAAAQSPAPAGDSPWYKDKNTMGMMLAALSNGFGGMTLRGRGGMQQMNNAVFAQGMKNQQNNKTIEMLEKTNPELAKLARQYPQYVGKIAELSIANQIDGGGLTDATKTKIQAAQLAGLTPGTPEFEAFISGKDSPDEKTFDRESGLRTEFNSNGEVKAFADMSRSFGRLRESVGTTAADDMALIFNYMKMLDPGSTVREGEFATAQDSAGIPTRIRNLYNQAIDGVRLAPEQREQMFAAGERIYTDAEERYTGIRNQYTGIASGYGLGGENPDSIFVDHRRDFSDEPLNFGYEENTNSGGGDTNTQLTPEFIESETARIKGLPVMQRMAEIQSIKENNPELAAALGL